MVDVCFEVHVVTWGLLGLLPSVHRDNFLNLVFVLNHNVIEQILNLRLISEMLALVFRVLKIKLYLHLASSIVNCVLLPDSLNLVIHWGRV